MDEFQQDPILPQNSPRRVSFFGTSTANAFLAGTIGAALGIFIGNVLFKTQHKLKSGLFTALGWGVGFAAGHLILRKPEPQSFTLLPPALPPTLPAQPRPNDLALATIPQILDMLVAKGELSAEQQAQILTDIKQGHSGCAGELAVAKKFITHDQLQAALAEQAPRKAEAAIHDINAISAYGTITGPTWLMANWGNNGVNVPPTHPTRTDGASAAANIAQNLVLLANTTPDPQMRAVISKGVLAAAYLTRGITQGDSATIPLAKMHEQWRETMNNALILAVQANPASPHAPRDANGKPVDIYTYIAARNAEVTMAVAQTLHQPPQHGASQAR